MVCDRFSDSSYAYQCCGRGLDAGLVRRLEEIVHPGLQPDATFLSDIDPATAARRQDGRGAKTDKFETRTSRISSGMNRLSENLMMMFGVQMGAEFAMEGVRAYAAQAESQQRLLVALGNRADVQQRLIKQADELKEAYLFDDDVINQAQAFLAAQGRREAQINKVTKAAAGMSRALGIDYQTAIEMLDSTLEGNRGRLGKYAGEVKKLTDSGD